jgi:circadian clock protein KaiB
MLMTSDDAGQSGLKIRLYITGSGPNSTLAVENLRRLCQHQAIGEDAWEMIDIAKDPTRALADQVFFTPMLVIRQGDDEQRFVGNLSKDAAVIRALAQGSASNE